MENKRWWSKEKIEWYERAAKQNYESAVKALNEMKNKN